MTPGETQDEKSKLGSYWKLEELVMDKKDMNLTMNRAS